MGKHARGESGRGLRIMRYAQNAGEAAKPRSRAAEAPAGSRLAFKIGDIMEGIMRLALGALASNCYIIPADEDKVIVVDPASEGEVEAVIDSNDLEIGGIIITHGHFDHFAGAAALKEVSGAPIYAPELDTEMLQSADKSWAWFMQGIEFTPVRPDYTFSDGDVFSICGVEFRVMAAPGHTGGSCLLFCDKYGVIITGDVIFRGSIGRTDGFSGSGRLMSESLRKIRSIQGDYILLCGHDDPTDLETEKKTNPYLTGMGI